MQWTGMQIAFATEYVVDGYSRRAAVRSGYAATSAANLASRMLRMPEMLETIAVVLEDPCRNGAVPDAQVLWRLSRLLDRIAARSPVETLRDAVEALRRCLDRCRAAGRAASAAAPVEASPFSSPRPVLPGVARDARDGDHAAGGRLTDRISPAFDRRGPAAVSETDRRYAMCATGEIVDTIDRRHR